MNGHTLEVITSGNMGRWRCTKCGYLTVFVSYSTGTESDWASLERVLKGSINIATPCPGGSGLTISQILREYNNAETVPN